MIHLLQSVVHLLLLVVLLLSVIHLLLVIVIHLLLLPVVHLLLVVAIRRLLVVLLLPVVHVLLAVAIHLLLVILLLPVVHLLLYSRSDSPPPSDPPAPSDSPTPGCSDSPPPIGPLPSVTASECDIGKLLLSNVNISTRSREDKYKILIAESNPDPRSYPRTRLYASGPYRQFNPAWLKQYPWLHYS